MTLWGGRFGAETDGLMREFGDSIRFDQRLYVADIQGSVAYAGGLARAGLITAGEHDQLVTGLAQVQAEFDAGTFQIQPGDEDIHTAVERGWANWWGRWRASCTPAAPATTRWPPTCASICWTRWPRCARL